MLDHTLFVNELGISKTAREIPGFILDQDGNKMDPCAGYEDQSECDKSVIAVGVQGKPDIFPLNLLLKAAGTTLDSASQASVNETMRYGGIILAVRIIYDNTYTYSSNNYEYNLKVSLVKDTEFKVKEYVFAPGSSGFYGNSLVYNRHGVRVLFTVSGEVGVFDPQTLLVNLVSSMGLFAVAVLIVDFLMMRVLKHKDQYAAFKYYQTEKVFSESEGSGDDDRVSIASSNNGVHLSDQGLAAERAANRRARNSRRKSKQAKGGYAHYLYS